MTECEFVLDLTFILNLYEFISVISKYLSVSAAISLCILAIYNYVITPTWDNNTPYGSGKYKTKTNKRNYYVFNTLLLILSISLGISIYILPDTSILSTRCLTTNEQLGVLNTYLSATICIAIELKIKAIAKQ